ncbi:MAG TPA: division/cell wall cluster transcriptional repressor MraZ [Dehalococcoidales bacterium]|nr:MAG: division/cell wall cluster transcriptional repressor MraZ [Chloroflexi bacterium RBG_16_60_22]HJX13820.1 division/cell wall cluster transcriptional repressor MraZ [Dehalococcoidales bacterium]
MPTFYGEFDYKIDDKGRVPIPPRFRNALKDGVVLTPGAEKCITAYTIPEWRKVSEKLTGSGLSRSKMRRLSRAIFGTAFSTKIDNQGRIALPAPLREHAEIVEEVVITGANTYLEIWNKVHWEEEKEISQEQAWQIIESLENS